MKYVAAYTTVPIYSETRIGCLVDELLYGMECDVIEEYGEFYKIKTFYSYEGYVIKNQIMNNNSTVKKKLQVKHYSADILDFPKVQGKIIITLTKGCIFYDNEFSNNGYRCVQLLNNDLGFVKESLIEEVIGEKEISSLNQKKFGIDVLNTADEYLKSPYRWGGKTPLGIDCSGLAFMSYHLNGVKIYRDAKIHKDFPIKIIKLEKIKVGDLLFFPGHVAIYAGEGRFIHSSESNPYVQYNSFNSSSKDFRCDLQNSLLYAGSIFT